MFLIISDVINFCYFNGLFHAPEGTIWRTLVTPAIVNVFNRTEHQNRLHAFSVGQLYKKGYIVIV